MRWRWLMVLGLALVPAPAALALNCPAGFLALESTTGDRALGCISAAEEAATSGQDAADECLTDHGGRVASPQEWYLAFSQLSPAFTQTAGN